MEQEKVLHGKNSPLSGQNNRIYAQLTELFGQQDKISDIFDELESKPYRDLDLTYATKNYPRLPARALGITVYPAACILHNFVRPSPDNRWRWYTEAGVYRKGEDGFVRKTQQPEAVESVQNDSGSPTIKLSRLDDQLKSDSLVKPTPAPAHLRRSPSQLASSTHWPGISAILQPQTDNRSENELGSFERGENESWKVQKGILKEKIRELSSQIKRGQNEKLEIEQALAEASVNEELTEDSRRVQGHTELSLYIELTKQQQQKLTHQIVFYDFLRSPDGQDVKEDLNEFILNRDQPDAQQEYIDQCKASYTPGTEKDESAWLKSLKPLIDSELSILSSQRRDISDSERRDIPDSVRDFLIENHIKLATLSLSIDSATGHLKRAEFDPSNTIVVASGLTDKKRALLTLQQNLESLKKEKVAFIQTMETDLEVFVKKGTVPVRSQDPQTPIIRTNLMSRLFDEASSSAPLHEPPEGR